MPIEKYRSVEEMPSVATRTPLDPNSIRIACELSETVRGFHHLSLDPGVERYRSVAEMEQNPHQPASTWARRKFN